MRKLITILLTVILFACNDDDKQQLPECLVPIVDVILEQNVQNPRANIELYYYNNNNEVYVVNAQNFPDGQSYVITLDCEDICVLGGFDGTDNDCPNWYDNDDVYRIRVIWTDPR